MIIVNKQIIGHAVVEEHEDVQHVSSNGFFFIILEILV